MSRAFRHEALLYEDAEEFLAATVPFVQDALQADEPVIAGLTPTRRGWLQDALGADAKEVGFVDMVELGSNPARVIPRFREFLDEHANRGVPVRAIGEPVWAGRRPEEVAEAELHEALVNVAVEPDTPCWLLCTYNVDELAPAVIDEAYRSHPAVVTGSDYRGSHSYGGLQHIEELFGAPLPRLSGHVDELAFGRTDLQQLSTFVATKVYAAGVTPDKGADLAVAVHELASNSLQRGAVEVIARVWALSDSVVCEVQDETFIRDPMTGRRASSNAAHRGVWLANQLCDLVQLRSSADGTLVRLHHWL